MKAEQFTEWLKKHNACEDAIEWQEGKDLTIVWQTCHRGDWMLWLAKRAGVEKRLLVLTAAHCANTVRHLMKDERSRNAVDVAIRYGEGKATVEELQVAAYAAYAAYAYAADAAAAAAAAAAPAAAARAAAAAASDAARADAARAAAAAAASVDFDALAKRAFESGVK